jgi:hypothetical protein
VWPAVSPRTLQVLRQRRRPYRWCVVFPRHPMTHASGDTRALPVLAADGVIRTQYLRKGTYCPLSEVGYVLGETRAMANWEDLTEILPKSYRNLTTSALPPLYFASLLGIKCNRESYRGGDGIQDSLALGKYGAARNCGRTRNGCHTACAHQCRGANRLPSSDLFTSDRTGAMLTQPQRAGAGPRPQQHHGIRREL